MGRPQKEITEIILEVNTSDLCAVWLMQEAIKERIKKNRSIPPNALGKFFSYFTIQFNRLAEEYAKILGIAEEKTKNRFLKDKRFKFTSVRGLPDPCNIDSLIENCFASLKNQFPHIERTRDFHINAIYLNIEEYFRGHYEFKKRKPDSERIFQHYKRSVLAGYITMKLGFPLSKELRQCELEGNEPTNEQIYQAVKYHTGKLREASQLRKKKKHK